MKNFFSIFPILSLFIVSCKDDDRPLTLWEQSEERCREEMVFTCEEPLTDIYFYGKLDGKEFCISYPQNGNQAGNGLGTITTTSTEDPVLTPDDVPFGSFFGMGIYPELFYGHLYDEFEPYVEIQTPSIEDTVLFPIQKYVDDFIHDGDLDLREGYLDYFSGFYFSIGWMCDVLPGRAHYLFDEDLDFAPTVGNTLSPSAGPQDEDTVFRVTEFKKEENADFISYEIVFEIECKLYYAGSSKKTEYFGRLEDGEFRTQFIVQK